MFPIVAIVAAVALGAAGCSKSGSPTSPTSTSGVSGVSFDASSVAAGSDMMGTVRLTLAAGASGASVVLVSSNPSVATVPTPAVIAAGDSTVRFRVTTRTSGNTTITATLAGTSAASALTVTPGPVLSTLTLNAPSVVGGNPVVGTVTLSVAAGVGGVLVTLAAADPATVPPTVLVPAGLTSASFNVATRPVGGTVAATVSATWAGVSRSANLSVLAEPEPTVAVARFGVSSSTESETCEMTNGGDTLDCTFNGSSSSAPGTIVEWNWSWSIAGTASMKATTAGPVFAMPAASCAMLPAPPLPAGVTSFPLVVKLVIRDSLGNVSADAVDPGARVLPQGVCGF